MNTFRAVWKLTGIDVLFLCLTQVQKIRKALEELGKEFKDKNMNTLKVTIFPCTMYIKKRIRFKIIKFLFPYMQMHQKEKLK